MKTAVSIDDDLMREADRTARKLHLSRSRLFAVALEEYLRRRRDEEILEQLNRVYGNDPQQEERALAAKIKSKLRSTIKEPW